jgi:hypothetical protein
MRIMETAATAPSAAENAIADGITADRMRSKGLPDAAAHDIKAVEEGDQVILGGAVAAGGSQAHAAYASTPQTHQTEAAAAAAAARLTAVHAS